LLIVVSFILWFSREVNMPIIVTANPKGEQTTVGPACHGKYHLED